ncbi:MAG: TIGR00730 family Rossman fold protein [Bacteroidales bacterium]|jgi:uncharacterized protein (TIGR00730 family)
MIHTVTIYCASSHKVDKKYFTLAKEVAEVLCNHQVAIRYGGGAVGLMGQVADTTLEKNGQITGIIPEFMIGVEWNHPQVEDMIIVADMAERKRLLMQNTDAIIVLPGGTGTLEEVTEVLTLKRLGKFTKPIVFMNLDEFYTPLLKFFDTLIDEKFLRPEHRAMWTECSHANRLMETLHNAPKWDGNAITFAAV